MHHYKLPSCGLLLLSLIAFGSGHAQTPGTLPAQPQAPAAQTLTVQQDPDEAKKEKAEEQLKKEEHQRILGVIPEFNTSNLPDAVGLSPSQKWELTFKGAVDPFVFVFDALDAGVGQWENAYPEYGQGAKGYLKRFGANYADSFDGAILGNAVFPILLHEDPRYFRKGTGSITSRIWYAIASTYRCKNDDGKWVANYGNLLGNLAAGGIANLYYPASDRGFTLTVERGVTVTAEGALGALGYEFWPDIQRRYLHRHREDQASAAQ